MTLVLHSEGEVPVPPDRPVLTESVVCHHSRPLCTYRPPSHVTCTNRCHNGRCRRVLWPRSNGGDIAELPAAWPLLRSLRSARGSKGQAKFRRWLVSPAGPRPPPRPLSAVDAAAHGPHVQWSGLQLVRVRVRVMVSRVVELKLHRKVRTTLTFTCVSTQLGKNRALPSSVEI